MSVGSEFHRSDATGYIGRRRKLAGSDRVVLDRVIHKMPLQPP